MKKRKGFSGERIIDVDSVLKDEDSKGLIFSKIGFFPKARHQHSEGRENSLYILLYCIDGIGEVVIDGHQHVLNIGDFVIIPKLTDYAYYANKGNPWSFYWFYFKDDLSLINNMLDFFYKRNKMAKGNLSYNEERIALFGAIFDNLNKGYSTDNLLILNMCLINFLSSLVFSFALVKKDQQDKSKNRIEEAIDFMKNRVEGNLTLAELSKMTSLSNSQFSHLFKETTGISPLEYFNQLKIKRAARYLENTGLQMKQIAYKVGIQDAAYFSRLFTKIMGISPIKYKQSLLQK
ncbi:AraC family transcriptional regulator [Pseudopedobacter saltans]|nr:AraC family transcriptional regulator [Pseudopedobacter saltans]